MAGGRRPAPGGLAGHSSATQVAAKVSAASPDLVAATVLASPTVDPKARSVPKVLYRWRRDAAYPMPGLSESHRPEWRRAGTRQLVHLLRAHLRDRLEETVPRIRGPLLVLLGREDRTRARGPRRSVSWYGNRAMRPKRAVASFDSASTFHRVLAQHLHGRSSPALGLGPAARAVSRLLPVVNHAPRAARETLYIWSGWSEAVRPNQAGTVDTDAIAEWACEQYPRRRYPAVFIGSSSGAAAHLAALAGVPWLPQTFLVPVRHRRLDPDEPPAR